MLVRLQHLSTTSRRRLWGRYVRGNDAHVALTTPPPPRTVKLCLLQGDRTQHDFSLWSGWKQPDFAVEVDTARLETSRFKKCCEKCVLLYYPSTEFKSAFNVYWHGERAAGLSCTKLSIWEFSFLRGDWRQGGIIYDIVWMGCPRRKP